jgi:hypothetical protein
MCYRLNISALIILSGLAEILLKSSFVGTLHSAGQGSISDPPEEHLL